MARQEQYSDDDILDMLRLCEKKHEKVSPRIFNDMEETCSASLVMRRFGGWTDAKEEAGIEDADIVLGRPGYSDEQILSHLRECMRQHGKCTVKLVSENPNWIAPSVAVERFGSWRQAKVEAGIGESEDEVDDRQHNKGRARQFSDDDYLELLRECEKKHGKVTQRIFNNDDEFPTAGAVRNRFGSWSDAKEKAGIENSDNREYSDDELIEMLQECQSRHGSASATTFASDPDFCSPETLQRRFGGWTAAKEEADVN